MDLKKIKAEQILFLLLATQIINVLDYMMVMPLGPDFTRDLGIPSSKLGWIGGSYTAAACLSSFILSFILDRFDRKKALLFSFFGLILSTLAAIEANNFSELLLARVVAGAFGGPTSSLCVSIVSDIYPAEKRGLAMGKLMMGFSLASIFGIPFGLELARLWGWKAPFVFLGFAGALLWLALFIKLPTLSSHLEDQSQSSDKLFQHLFEKKYLLAMATIMLSIFSVFLVIPNIAAYVQFNRDWPREHMWVLYLCGGILSILATRLGGPWIDRVGIKFPVFTGTTLLSLVLLFGFIFYIPLIPLPVYFACFMLSSTLRNMNAQILITQVPPAHLRANFMSLMNSVTHLSSASGAFVAASLLTNDVQGKLIGIEKVSALALILSLGIPILLFALERLLKANPR